MKNQRRLKKKLIRNSRKTCLKPTTLLLLLLLAHPFGDESRLSGSDDGNLASLEDSPQEVTLKVQQARAAQPSPGGKQPSPSTGSSSAEAALLSPLRAAQFGSAAFS